MSEVGTLRDALGGLNDPPNWVLLDLMLPDGCGIEMIRVARSRQIQTRFCIVTGCGTEMADAARDAGAEHVFTKPLDLERLTDVLAD